MPKMSREQRDYLWSRLRAATREQEISWDSEAPETPELVKARALIAKAEKAHEEKRKRVNAAVQKRLDAAKEALYAGDYDRALEAVKRFEASGSLNRGRW